MSFIILIATIAYSSFMTSYNQTPVVRGLQMLVGFHPQDLMADPAPKSPGGEPRMERAHTLNPCWPAATNGDPVEGCMRAPFAAMFAAMSLGHHRCCGRP